MRDYIVTDMMFMLNGPGAIDDKSRKLRQSVDQIKEITACGLFATDCLITWGKSIGFLEEQKFRDIVNGLLGDDRRYNAAILGTVWRKHLLCWAGDYCLGVERDYVELGCFTGDTVKMIMAYTGFASTAKTYWMYDLFEDDGRARERLPQLNESLYQHTLAKFADMPNVRIIRGKIPDSLSEGRPDRIALLHVDMNNAIAERAALEHLYDAVQPAGLIIFDDYGWLQYRAQKDTIDEFMNARGKKVFELPTGQGLVIK